MATYLPVSDVRRWASEDFGLEADGIISSALTGARDAFQAAAEPVQRSLASFTIPSLSSLTSGWGDDTNAAPPGAAPAPATPEPAPARSSFSIPSLSSLTAGWESEPKPPPTPAPAAPLAPLVSPTGPSGGAAAPGPEAPAPSDFRTYVRQAAAARGLDPEQVAAVMGKEGPAGWGAVGTFATGTSYGPLQLHYAGGPNPKAGMGDDFTRDTGIDLRTDRSLAAHQRAVDYALDRLSKTGDFREWYGADPALGSRFTKVNRVAPKAPAADLGAVARTVGMATGPVGAALGSAAAGAVDVAPVRNAARGAALGAATAVPDAVVSEGGDGRAAPRAFGAGSWTPNQYTMATAEGLDSETAWAVCGPAAAIAFARRTGRNPTMQEAVGLAKGVGWTVAAGMAGPASQRQLLQNMGIAATLEDGAPNWQKVIADVQRGNPVTISTPGHYFVAERYNPETGELDFGQSATVLKASGGRRWFTPEAIGSLGMGAPRGALYLDNPESPAPSIAAGRSPERQEARRADTRMALGAVTGVGAGADVPVLGSVWDTIAAPVGSAIQGIGAGISGLVGIPGASPALDPAAPHPSIAPPVIDGDTIDAPGSPYSPGQAASMVPPSISTPHPTVTGALGRAIIQAPAAAGRAIAAAVPSFRPEDNPALSVSRPTESAVPLPGSPYAPGQVAASSTPPEYAMPESPSPWSLGRIGEGLSSAVAPARRAYEQTIAEANADADAQEALLQSRMSEFGRAVNQPLAVLNRGLRIARDVVLETPHAAAEEINAALAPVGLDRETLGLDLPVFGRVGLADVIDLPGPLGKLSSLGIGRAGVLGATPTRLGEAAASVLPGRFGPAAPIERATSALLGAAGEAMGPAISAARSTVGDVLEGVRGLGARIAPAGDELYGTSLFVPDPTRHAGQMPIPTRRPRGVEAPAFTQTELEAYGDAADALVAGRSAPATAPVEWRPVGVTIANGGQYDGNHVVSMPFFQTQAGPWVPLPWKEMGGRGTPGNSAYSKAVSVGGGRLGYPFGQWTDARGVAHTFDSPQEILFMADLDRQMAAGEIADWWQGKSGRMPEVEQIPYFSTNRDKGGPRVYEADFFYRDNDGNVHVVEGKPAKVIVKAEEYGTKAGKVTGKMGWDVTKKAAGIIAQLADYGVDYRLLLGRDSSRLMKQFARTATGKETKNWAVIPGVDPRDVPALMRKGLAPDANSPGNDIADLIHDVSTRAVVEARRLQSLGIAPGDRLELLTRFVRDELLPTAERVGREAGMTRALTMGGAVDLPGAPASTGATSLEDLGRSHPEAASILREMRRHGADLTQLSAHPVALPDGTPGTRLHIEGTGDPQSPRHAVGRLAERYGLEAAYWYPDTEGPHPLVRARLRPEAVEAAGSVDWQPLERAVTEGWENPPRLAPVYNSAGQLTGFDALGRRPDGSAVPERELRVLVTRAQDGLAASGFPVEVGPTQRAEISHMAGEPGHAAGPAETVRETEYLLGRRPVPLPERAANAGGAGAGGPGARGGADLAPAGAGSAGLADGGGSAEQRIASAADGLADDVDEEDLLLDDDDDVLYGVSLTTPLPGGGGSSASGTGMPLGTRLATEAGRAIVGGMGGASYSAATGDQENLGRNVALGAGAALAGGRLMARPRGAALASLAGPPGPPPQIGVNVGGIPGRSRPLAPSGGAAAAVGPAGGFQLGATLRKHTGIAAAFDEAQQRAATMQAQGLEAPSFWDWAKRASYAGIYSPATAVSSLLGGALELADAIPRGQFVSLREGRGVAAGASLQGAAKAAGEGVRGAARAIMGGAGGASAASGGPIGMPAFSERVANPWAYMAARAMEKSGEVFTEAPDALLRPGFIALGERQAAERVAQELGQGSGYVDTLLAEAERLRANPGARSSSAEAQRVVDAGKAYADEAGYKGPPGEAAAYLGRMAKQDNLIGLLATIAMPFTGMAGRVVQATGRSLPGVGLHPKLRAGRPSADVLYDQVRGGIVAAGVAAYAANGGVTGTGPADPDQRASLVAEGWSPQSFFVGVPGVGGYYLPNRLAGRWQPILDTAGEIHDALAYGKKDRNMGEMGAELLKRIGSVAADQTGLSGLGDLMDIVNGGLVRQGPGYLARTAVRMVPGGATVRQVAAALDPEQRRADRWTGELGDLLPSIGEQLKTAVPGLRQTVPAAQDVLGRPVPNPQAGARAFAPRFTEQRHDPLLAAYREADLDIGAPPKSFTVDGVKIALTPEQQRAYQRAFGRALERRAPRAMNATGARRTQRLQAAYEAAREDALKVARADIGRGEIRQRVRAGREEARRTG